MKSLSSSVRFNQLTRTLFSKFNGIWSFNISWCRIVMPQTDDHSDDLHKHSIYEIQLVIEGALLVHIGKQREIFLNAGQFIMIPPQVQHSISFCTPNFQKLVLAFSINDANRVIEKVMLANNCEAYNATQSMYQILDALRPKLVEFNELTAYIISYLLQGFVLEALDVIAPAPLSLASDPADEAITANDKRLKQANSIIHGNILYPITGEELAQELGITVRHLNRIFADAYGCSVSKQIQKARIAHAQHLLNTTTLSLADIAESMQYSSVYAFIRAFTNVTGVSPGKYRYGTIVHKELCPNDGATDSGGTAPGAPGTLK